MSPMLITSTVDHTIIIAHYIKLIIRIRTVQYHTLHCAWLLYCIHCIMYVMIIWKAPFLIISLILWYVTLNYDMYTNYILAYLTRSHTLDLAHNEHVFDYTPSLMDSITHDSDITRIQNNKQLMLSMYCTCIISYIPVNVILYILLYVAFIHGIHVHVIMRQYAAILLGVIHVHVGLLTKLLQLYVSHIILLYAPVYANNCTLLHLIPIIIIARFPQCVHSIPIYLYMYIILIIFTFNQGSLRSLSGFYGESNYCYKKILVHVYTHVGLISFTMLSAVYKASLPSVTNVMIVITMCIWPQVSQRYLPSIGCNTAVRNVLNKGLNLTILTIVLNFVKNLHYDNSEVIIMRKSSFFISVLYYLCTCMLLFIIDKILYSNYVDCMGNPKVASQLYVLYYLYIFIVLYIVFMCMYLGWNINVELFHVYYDSHVQHINMYGTLLFHYCYKAERREGGGGKEWGYLTCLATG